MATAAARTVSQVVTHMAIGFVITYAVTGSLVFGGLAILLEPVLNVMAVPLHQRLWKRLRRAAARPALTAACEKFSQAGLHMLVAFGVMYWASGSAAFGGLAAVLEPICNVLLMPLHDRLWESRRAGLATA